MRIQRTLPPVAPPLSVENLRHGLAGVFCGERYLKKLEEEIKEYFNVRSVFFVSSGKAALYLILHALHSLSPKRQVVIPAYTCFSIPSAISKAGLKISPCDINPETFDFDYNLLEKTINQDTLCIIPHHLFGIPSDMDKITSLCKDRGVFIVEDAAQAMGERYNGKMLGTIGDVGFFSLGRGKNITCGTGGIVVTNSSQIADSIEKQYAALAYPSIVETITEFLQVAIMGVLIHPLLYWLPSGLPFLKLGQTIFYKDFPVKKLSGLKAGLLNGWRERLEESNRIRAEIAEYYTAQIQLKPHRRPKSSYLRFPVILQDKERRDRIYSQSRERGLGITPMYPTSISKIEEIKSEFTGMRFPVAEEIAERLLTIPTHHFVSEKDKKAICGLLRKSSKRVLFVEYHSNCSPANRYQVQVFEIIETLLRHWNNGELILIAEQSDGGVAKTVIQEDEVRFIRQLVPVVKEFLS